MHSSTVETQSGSGSTAVSGTGAFRLFPALLLRPARLARAAARLPGLVLPDGVLRRPPHSHRAADVMGRPDRARQERHSRRLTVPRRRPAGAAPYPSSPGFLPRLWRAAAACLVGLAVLGFAGTAAQAQTSVTLVSNHGQSSAWASIDDNDHRTQFTTGSHAGGYRLTGVTVALNNIATSTVAFGVAVGGSSLTETRLTAPASLTDGNNTFTASGNGIDLAANTTYYVWLEVTDQGNGQGFINRTTSGDEDSGAAAGWSIANNGENRVWNLANWSSTSALLKFAIKGYELAAPTETPAAPTVSAVPLQPDRLAVRWTVPAGTGITDYDVRYYKGSADPANEADWIEAGETGGHDHAGTLTQATITGLDPVATYRVQVRAGKGVGKGPWSASGSGRTEALVGAWGSSMLELVGNTGETVNGNYSLASVDVAQGFRAAGHGLGYTVTDVDVHFQTAPDAGVRVRLATGVSTSSAGTTLATLRNPAALTAGVNTFAAPAGTTLDANTTYHVVVEGAAGSVSTTSSNDQDGLLGWSIIDTGHARPASLTGGWQSQSSKHMIRVNGRENVGDPPGAPGAPTVTAVTGSTGVTVAWSAPAHTGSGITDYDVRYYQGSADPANERDWVEEDETTGLPFKYTPDASTSATITGLLPSTAYRVQVRAESHNAPGPWSDASSVTTNAATGTNNAPTLAQLAPVAADGCIAYTGSGSRGTFSITAGVLQSVRGITGTSQCVDEPRRTPVFIDPDGDDLAVIVTSQIPDNVRLINGTPFIDSATDRFFIRAVAAGSVTSVRVDLTAVDPHGVAVSAWFDAEVSLFPNNATPRFDEMVGTRGFPVGAPVGRWVLPPANGGDMVSKNETGQLPYFYAVSGLPPGLAFDPMTRTVTGTPTEAGTYTVTYTADDADAAYSLKDSPTAADLADVARQSFVVQVGAPAIELVRMASAPTYDANNDGQFDTYIAGDTILVDVQFTEPVEVTGTPETAGATPRLRLDVGPSSNSQADNRETMGLLEDGGSLYGGRRLRFGYTVKATDTDPDGVWVQSTGANDVVLFVPKGLSLVSKESGAAVVRSFSGLPTSGAANAKVDGSKSSDDIGPQPVSAATDAAGDTVTVTFSRALSNQVDLSGVPLPYYLSVRGAGVVGAGQRDHFQHPNTAYVSGDGKLVLELNTPVRASDTVTLSYENAGSGVWPLKDASSRRVAGFSDFAVANGRAAAQFATGLVGNLGQAKSDTAQLAVDIAQGFTTGSNADGYVLDAVVVAFASTPTGMTVQLATGVSTTSAGTTVATLTNPATLAVGENRFTAPGDTRLSADTQYFVVVQSSAAFVAVRRTTSKTEDAGAAAGWSIADESRYRSASSTGAFSTVSTSDILKMRVDGYANSLLKAPAPVSASAVGTALELVFDQRLDQDSRPPGSAFTVSAEDRNHVRRTIAGTGSAVLIDDARVAVTLAAAVRSDELLRVSYAKPAQSPLRAAAGSPDVLSFEGFHVEGVHDSTPPKLTGAVFIQNPEQSSQSKVTLYFDEALDTSSVPAGTDFEVRLRGQSGQGFGVLANSVTVANNAVTFVASGISPDNYWLKYTPPATGGIRDLAGNPAAKIDGETWAKRSPAKPNAGSSPTVDGVLLIANFGANGLLDPTSVPDPSAFTLHDTDAVSTQLSTSVEAVILNLHRVNLRLAYPVLPCAGATPIRVKYTKPTGASDAKLRGITGDSASEADGFIRNVTNLRHSKCVTRQVSGNSGPSGSQGPVWQGRSVTLPIGKSLDTAKTLDPDDFTVAANGASGSPAVRGASYTADGTGVALALSRARSAGETATLGYTWPKSGQGLWDANGNQIDSFSGLAVKDDEAPTGFSASFYGLPDAHDGSRLFAFEVRFSEEFQGMRLTAVKQALAVTGGRLVDAKRTVRGENRRVTVRVRPSRSGAVTLALAAPSDCSAADAICASDGRKLSAAVSASVPGPDTPAALPVLSVADARADEGGSLAFAVTLSEAAAGDVTVDYATSDGTATAGADYTAASGTLTFAAGETEKTVSVALLHDGSAENDETVTLTLTNPSGATVGDGEATGTVADVAPLTASFHGLPEEHDGRKLFAFEVRFSEEFQGLRLAAFKAGALQVTNGRVIDAKRTVRGQNRSVTVKLRPSSTDDMTITLPATADCSAASAICTHDGRKLSNTVTASVRGPVAVSVADAEAQEGVDAAVSFAVTLSRAASGDVTVNYATRDGTATAGEDYTFTRGTLTFAAGETAKTVEVPILDDALDEGSETFTLKLTGARGAAIADGEATGTIRNSDPLQKMWLSRFGRTVADHVTAAVSDRLSGPLTGAQVTVGGQTMNLAELEDEAFLGRTLTAIAQTMGAPSGPASGGDPGSGSLDAGDALGPGNAPTATSAPGRLPAGRELLLGSAFHLAKEGDGYTPGLAAWGRVTVGGFDGEAPADAGNVRIDGDVTTGIIGTDAEWSRLLAGVAVSVSEGEGRFDQPGVDSGTIESTMTTVSPYARLSVNERLSVWGLAGYGTGDMTIVQRANAATGQPERTTRTDLSMRLAALGGRGALLTPDANGGMDLALKADGFFVETTSEAISNEGDTSADASRVRLALEGSRAFRVGDGAFTPGLELGLRHDGGDAETGTGVELGGRLSYADPGTGLSVDASLRALVAHEDSNYREWGASGAVRLAPGERGRGLSFSLAPTYGAPGSGVDRLWSAQDARGLAPTGGAFEPESRLEGELGYGMALFGDRFTGTPNLGFGLSGAGARDYRLGWRLGLARSGPGSFEVTLDATRSEPANDNGAGAAKHGIGLRLATRW